MNRNLPLALVPIVLSLAYFAVSQDTENVPVEVAVLNEENFDRLAPQGKEVDAIYGDVVLRNKHLVAVIAAPLPTRHANMTVSNVGGSLIDLTARDSESDQLSCFYPARVSPGYRNWTVSTRETKDVHVAKDLSLRSGRASVTVAVDGDQQRPRVETEYSLSTDSRLLTVTTRYTNSADEPITFSVGDSIRADGRNEDMAKAPNGVTDMYWFEDRFWGQAYGVRSPARKIQSNSDTRNGNLSYLDGNASDKVTLQPGQTHELVREIACGANRIDVAAGFGLSDGDHYVPVSLALWNARRRPIPGARLEVSKDGELIGVAVADNRGEVTLPLRPGRYAARILQDGIALRESETLLVSDSLRQDESIIIDEYNPGYLRLRVTEKGSGSPIPCKVEINGKDGAPTPNFGPETAESAVRNLRYAPHGEIRQELVPGTYDLIISHGPEYEAVFTTVTVEPSERRFERPTEIQLERVVDTTGWVSSDFHSHSSPSGDNTSSQLGRVLNLLCEHLEFAPCTEHNRISSYDPHIDALDVRRFMATTTGMELTGRPLPLNHQNVFPLHHHPHRQDGGAPVTDSDPNVQVERLASWDNGSEKLIQQNHPDVGWLVYDRDGNEIPDHGHERVLTLIDVMEIHPVDRVLDLVKGGVNEKNVGGNRVFRWLQLLNQGYRIPGVVNTDAHYNYHGSGGLRNWIQSSTDDPARIDTMEMVHAAEEGRLVMSNGPFLEVSCTEQSGSVAVTAGQELSAPKKKVELDVRVSAPSWIDVDVVFVLVNGRLHADHVYRRSTHPDKFGAGADLFHQTLPITLDGDAHIVVACGSLDSKLGRVLGPDWGRQSPAALANPIYVDTDGNGFNPNEDTLGLPLPVKGK